MGHSSSNGIVWNLETFLVIGLPKDSIGGNTAVAIEVKAYSFDDAEFLASKVLDKPVALCRMRARP